MALSMMDIKLVARDTSPQVRAELVGKISHSMQQGTFSSSETHIAYDILRILSRDIESQVRRAVALSLCNSTNAPHDIMLRLAQDVADVALPVLQFSKVLTEEDLLQLVEQAEEVVKLVAIAKRSEVSSKLGGALIRSGDEKVIYTVFRNHGASVPETALESNWRLITENESLTELLVQSGKLSPRLAEKLMTVVSEEMKRLIATNYRLPLTLAEDAIDQYRETKTIEVLSPAARNLDQNDYDVEGLVHQLYTCNRLTYSIIIRSLCSGDIDFFEAALSRLAGVPRANIKILMYDSGPLGLRAVYDKANMPAAFFEAIRTVLKLAHEIKRNDALTPEQFKHALIARVQDMGLDYTIENMQYLLSMVMPSTANTYADTRH